MGILQVPNQGQPLDTDYIAQMVQQINELTTAVGDRSTSYSNINNTSVKTSEVKIFATTINVLSSTNKTDGDTVDVTVNYPAFRGFPVITATVVSGASSNIGDTATVVFKNISSQQATMRVIFHRGGNLNINVNVLAVGFSETS